jgi:hypothetical protein
MAPSSQGLEPPGIPVRFISITSQCIDRFLEYAARQALSHSPNESQLVGIHIKGEADITQHADITIVLFDEIHTNPFIYPTRTGCSMHIN